MSDGQLAMNTNLVSPGLFLKDSNGDLVKAGPVHVGTTAPNATPGAGGQAGNSKGELWLDTSGSDYSLKTWDGTAFRAIVVTSTMIKDGTIVDADINASAAIIDTKLATIATAGKVSNSATTATNANTASAIVARDASGNFAAGTITAALTGNASTVTTNADLTGDVTSVGNATSIASGVIVNADVNASAAIAGTKISPDFGSQTIATTGVFSHALGAVATPSITFTGDLNTGFWSPAADTLAASTGGSERARIDSSGRLLVGTSTARATEPYGLGTEGQNAHTYESVGDSVPGPGIALGSNSSTTDRIGPYLYFFRSRGSSVGSSTIVSSGDNLGTISFAGADGTDVRTRGAAIYCEVDGTPGANDMPGRLVFSTTADGALTPQERMRIDSSGKLLVGTATDGGAGGLTIRPDSSAGAAALVFDRANTASTSTVVVFENNNGTVGSITYTNTTTAYNTSSDYRLKENVVALTGAADRINQLQVRRFNFIADPNTVVDGFIAHEAQEIVPECVTGAKDEVDEDGNPVYQGIDQSKLVPLLTAALQEAIAKIEALETRLSALEAA